MSEAISGQNEPNYFDTLPPDAISEELAPVIDELGLRENCRQLAMEGWTVVQKPASDEFNARFRAKIKELCPKGGGNMLLAKDPAFVEAVMNPSLMAMAEFSVGRGFLLSQVAASVRPSGSDSIGLHADNNWLPAPFPAHNMLLTACWATDGYTREGGATLVIPGSNNLRRHPNEKETVEKAGAIAIECEPGSVAMWDGNLWHANWPRKTEGERVVCHITYTRLMMRPVENYHAHAEELVAEYGETMSQLLGQNDLLDSPTGARYAKLRQTFNNAKR
ncbi:MAG: phytanoyl-CoA dioxygenase family protein [Proteobacteria bacterium]|jgi:ectoine hydroxylase-related dioxygenase (phytanoyl-CoA dioxygenase family)|nr:phytanoyl-CoA dioxygenase family protein [Pseudomonadota bacterium]MDA1299491.1 phytanoyl-CoA dioxygenase family protein [Pseudomonadota bacterium]